MYDFSKLTEQEGHTVVSALEGMRTMLTDKLEKPTLGDIERLRTQEYYDDVKAIMKKVGVQFG